MLARMERYAELRASGVLPPDAAQEVGLARWKPYENWYREQRPGLPRRKAGRFQ